MLKVHEILRVKGDALYTASPDMPIRQAVDTMATHDIGSLVIMEFGQLAGMVTFRELIRHLHTQDCHISDNTIRSIMDDAPVSVSPNTDIDEVRRLMLGHHARYLPVMDGPTLQGVISLYDVARAVVDAQEFENNMLKAYIRDWPTDSAATS